MRKRLNSWTTHALWIVAAGTLLVEPLCAQRPAATLVQMAGQVSILQDGGAQRALFTGNIVSAREVIVTGPDSYAKFLLPDNSTFEVFEKSQVTFNQDWPGGWTHLLNVWIGRVKLFIDHSRGPNHQQVTTPTAVISVRGTVFDVVVEDADGTTLVSVDDGLVQVRNVTAPGGEPLLHPGDSLRIFRNQPLAMQQIDKSRIAQQILRASRDLVMVIGRRPNGGIGPIGSGGGTTGPQGDTGKTTKPAPAPPPASGQGH